MPVKFLPVLLMLFLGEEFKQLYTGLKNPGKGIASVAKVAKVPEFAEEDLPTSFDWRNKRCYNFENLPLSACFLPILTEFLVLQSIIRN